MVGQLEWCGYRYSKRLIRLGRLDGGTEPLLKRGKFPARIQSITIRDEVEVSLNRGDVMRQRGRRRLAMTDACSDSRGDSHSTVVKSSGGRGPKALPSRKVG